MIAANEKVSRPKLQIRCHRFTQHKCFHSLRGHNVLRIRFPHITVPALYWTSLCSILLIFLGVVFGLYSLRGLTRALKREARPEDYEQNAQVTVLSRER